MVVRGKYTVLDMGELTPEIMIAMAGVVIVAVALHYHIKGAFCIGLVFGTIVWWLYEKIVPDLLEDPAAGEDYLTHESYNPGMVLLIFDLLFLMILTLNGLARAMSGMSCLFVSTALMLADLAHLTHENGAIPRGRWLFIVAGVASIVSGCLSGPPILISPESAAGIKAGAKTGLSTLVCGLLFGVSAFFSPLFAEVPAAGTAPLLIMVGVLLFQNAKRIDWSYIGKAVPSFCCLFFIPFTYSILRGVGFGYVTYIVIGMFTGDFWVELTQFLTDYLVPKQKDIEDDGEGDDGAPKPDEPNIFTVEGLMHSIANLDMTHTDENVVPITQDFDTEQVVGAVDVTHMEHIQARNAAAQKLASASSALQLLMTKAEILPRSRSSSANPRHRVHSRSRSRGDEADFRHLHKDDYLKEDL